MSPDPPFFQIQCPSSGCQNVRKYSAIRKNELWHIELVMKCLKPSSSATLKFLVSCFAASGFASAANIVIPAQTTIPIIFSHTVDSRRANPGDAVTATTLQVIELPSGQSIPKNSIVLGRIVDVQASAKNGSNSRLSIQFESIRVKNETIQIRVFVRALASPNESYDATHPTGPVGGDVLDTTTLIGGDYVYLSDKHLYSPGGDVLGESRNNGIFARLVPSAYHNRYGTFLCGGTDTVQSLAIYSTSACGPYGLGDTYMTAAGDADLSGVFTLESPKSFVRIYGLSTALLQVIGYV